MSSRQIIIVPRRAQSPIPRVLAWIPGVTQSITEHLPWRHLPVAFDPPETVGGSNAGAGRFLGNQPSYAETRVWKHPSPQFDAPESVPANGQTVARFFGPQPSYTEPTVWRHPAPRFDAPENEPGSNPNAARFLGPQPNRAETTVWRHPPARFDPPEPFAVAPKGWFPGLPNATQAVIEYAPWRHPPVVPEKIEGESGNGATYARLLGNQPNRAETTVWRHPPARFDPPEPFAVAPKGWFPGLPNATQNATGPGYVLGIARVVPMVNGAAKVASQVAGTVQVGRA